MAAPCWAGPGSTALAVHMHDCWVAVPHAGSRLPVQVSLANNVGLCGMIPNSVRFAHGFNTYNTGLGKSCPGDAAYPPQLAYASYAWPI